ncbi:MAG: AMP-binding protein, partial [Bacilli bacterium]|nr:AMP-binding protein [Bacilli bacterium]
MAKKYSAETIRKFTDLSKLIEGEDKTLADIYRFITEHNAKKVCCYYFDEDQKLRHYKYKEYDEKARDLAKRLSSILKDKAKDSVVALKVKNCPEWPLLFWAILMNGFRPLLIDARLAKENTQNLIRQGKAIALIANEVEDYDIPLIRVNNIQGGVVNNEFVENWANHVLFCSSGTTGDAKILIWDGQ